MVNVSRNSIFAAAVLSAGIASAGEVEVSTDDSLLMTQNGVTYVEGGVGNEQQDAINAAASDFSLHITFATNKGSYLSGVDAIIRNPEGESVLVVADAGPLLYVDLDPGSYTVELTPVEFEGDRQSHAVTISEEALNLNVTWDQ